MHSNLKHGLVVTTTYSGQGTGEFATVESHRVAKHELGVPAARIYAATDIGNPPRKLFVLTRAIPNPSMCSLTSC